MKKCEKCGFEVGDEATFCGNCGSRVDGKKECAVCGKPNDETFTFCMHCGARLDGKTVCKSCGTLYEGNFCYQCGAAKNSAAPILTPVSVPKAKVHTQSNINWKKIFEYVSDGLLALAVFSVLIFAFFIGVEAYASVASIELDGTTNIFYYFGDYYKELKEVVSEGGMTESYRTFLQTNLVLYGVFGTVFGAAAILSVWGLSGAAVAFYLLNKLGKTQKKADSFAIAAVLTFVVSSLAFFALHNTASTALGVSTGTKLNGATTAGIIISLVSVGLYLVCKLIKAGKPAFQKEALIRMGFSLLTFLLVGAVFGIAKYACIVQKSSSGTASVGYVLSNSTYDLLFSHVTMPSVKYEQFSHDLTVMNLMNIFAQVFVVAILIASASAIFGRIKQWGEEKKSSGMISPVLLVLFSIALLIFSILSHKYLANVVRLVTATEESKAKYGAEICLVVFSVLACVVAVARRIVIGKDEKPEQEEFQTIDSVITETAPVSLEDQPKEQSESQPKEQPEEQKKIGGRYSFTSLRPSGPWSK